MTLNQFEENGLMFLAEVSEFTLPDNPATNEKAAAIAQVMKGLVRKKLAVVVDTSNDTPPLPRWAITAKGRSMLVRVH